MKEKNIFFIRIMPGFLLLLIVVMQGEWETISLSGDDICR